MDTERPELKPCPFCGGPAEAVNADGDHTVDCANRSRCVVYAVAGPYPTAPEAAHAWNHRGVPAPERPLTQELVDRFYGRPLTPGGR